MAKMNCWEYKQCGRHVDGDRTREFGVCPVATESRVDGVHDGRNAGRACWIVAETLCNGEVQGNFIQKLGNCLECDFYNLVLAEEGYRISNATEILAKIR